MDGGLDAGLEYGIVSRVVVLTAEELDQVQNLTAVQYGPWTELPDLDPRIEQSANDWTKGEDSDYRKVLAIQQHFHSNGFRYETDVEVADDADALLTFPRKPSGLLPAVRHDDGGARPRARPAGADRGRVPGRHAPGRRGVPGAIQERPRPGRGSSKGTGGSRSSQRPDTAPTRTRSRATT